VASRGDAKPLVTSPVRVISPVSGTDRTSQTAPSPCKVSSKAAYGFTAPAYSADPQMRPYLAQELVLTARVVCYRHERWLTPDGVTTVAPRPSGTGSHLWPRDAPLRTDAAPPGPEPATAEAGVTIERLVWLLQAILVQVAFEAAQASLTLRPVGLLNRPRRPCYQSNRQLSGWIDPPSTGETRHRGALQRSRLSEQRWVRSFATHLSIRAAYALVDVRLKAAARRSTIPETAINCSPELKPTTYVVGHWSTDASRINRVPGLWSRPR
jgi:hypothetical protein